MVALNELSWSKFRFWHSASADPSKVVFVVDALSAAQLFIAIFLPFGDQVGVCPLFVQTIFVKFFTYFLQSSERTFFCNKVRRCSESFGDVV